MESARKENTGEHVAGDIYGSNISLTNHKHAGIKLEETYKQQQEC